MSQDATHSLTASELSAIGPEPYGRSPNVGMSRIPKARKPPVCGRGYGSFQKYLSTVQQTTRAAGFSNWPAIEPVRNGAAQIAGGNSKGKKLA